MADGDSGLPGGGPASDNDTGGSASGGGDSDGPNSGSQDTIAQRRENLRSSTMKAAMSTLAGKGGGGGDPDDPISKQTSKINHWMLEAEYEMIASDFSTLGLALIVTLPTRIIFCTILALELKHSFFRSKSMIPYFPTLTWESFMPPATEISVPLPTVSLQIAVLAYLIGVATITTVAVGIIAIILVGLGSAGTVVVEGVSSLFGS